MLSLKHIIEANGVFFVIAFSALSLTSVTMIIWRLWLNYTAKTDLSAFVAKLKETLTAGGGKAAIQLCEEEPGVIPQLFITALQTCHQGKVATRNAIANHIELEVIPKLNFLLPLLLVFAKLAPMLGLLGTVIGMILAFDKIAGATKVNPSDLAGDIGMALFTTAEGLLLAIPLIFAYSMFRERVNRFELDLQRAGQVALELVSQISAKK
ncbi:MAG: MotA/TolQ/ExbB proton channel family protein [Pirellulales bacterium]|nr:MotA/TolQ/ExbB proton channel family protein [Pirellulales bacterium]